MILNQDFQFYSWYLYPEPGKEAEYEFGECLSAAKYVDGSLLPIPFVFIPRFASFYSNRCQRGEGDYYRIDYTFIALVPRNTSS